MKGRKPIPKTILRLRNSGNVDRADRRRPKCPSRNIDHLDPPHELDEDRARLWESVSSFMADAGVLGQVSPYVLARYIDLLAAYHHVSAECGDNVLAAITAKCRLSPCLSKLESVLGLTPADRRNVTPAVETPTHEDPIQSLLESLAPTADAAAHGT